MQRWAGSGLGVAAARQQVREAFLGFFKANGHTVVPSASLVPERDASLLFVNAGMVPMKQAFLGNEEPPAPTVASAQRCLRASGKHNDLENVGFTERHHTLFEMLGNFSFGAYGARDAIALAWRFLTHDLGLEKDKLRVTVLQGDTETAEIWHRDHAIPHSAILFCGSEDNWWSIGATGPCGPCTEIFYQHTDSAGNPHWIEVWNIVMMTSVRDEAGEVSVLPRPCIDTGMGLERITAAVLGVPSNYDIPSILGLKHALFRLLEERTGAAAPQLRPGVDPSDKVGVAANVIADHVRAAAFLITDGVLPGNQGRGYLLRRLMRRAMRFGHTLGLSEPFLGQLLPVLQESMAPAYPELSERAGVVAATMQQEETAFYKTLQRGSHLLDAAVTEAQQAAATHLPARTVFTLYDTYGFPPDLTDMVARDAGLAIDTAEVDALMQAQRERGRASWRGAEAAVPPQVLTWHSPTQFTGFDTLSEPSARVLHSMHVVASLDDAGEDDDNGCVAIWLAITPCPFYARGGGQVGDRGTLTTSSGVCIDVLDAQTIHPGLTAVYARAPADAVADFAAGSVVAADVDAAHRRAVTQHHSATHLLHAALRDVLGPSAVQAGSHVSAHELRFDFSAAAAMTQAQLDAVQAWLDAAVARDAPVTTSVMSKQEAVQRGALSFFQDKYDEDAVRVVDMQGVSIELCGGTHVQRTGACFPIRIVSEGSVAAGTRRITAVAGAAAVQRLLLASDAADEAANLLRLTDPTAVPARVQRLLASERALKQQVASLKHAVQAAQAAAGPAAQRGVLPTGEDVLVHLVHQDDEAATDATALRSRLDALRQAQPDALHLVLGPKHVGLCVGSAVQQQHHAGALLKALLARAGGRGGGPRHMAQGVVQDVAEMARVLGVTR